MERIGPYRVGRTLGSGAMGVVLEAVDEGLQRVVALKVIAPHLASDPDFRERFVREARALAALDSPHVVRVYAHGEDDGRLWIATQLVPDGDLGKAGPLPLREAVAVVSQVAGGLVDAHAAGLVHRDIKPANVLLRRGPDAISAYLGDFGIARTAADPHRTGGAAAGTPSYMAPELHTGGTAGVASDVYSLGCLLWAAVGGHPPYDGSSDYEIARAHVEQPVPQLAGRSPLAREVNRILRRAMAKDPGDRYDAVAVLRADLVAAATLPDEPVGRRRLVAASAAVALVVTGLAGGWALTLGGDDRVDTTPRSDREVAVAHLVDGLRGVDGMSRAQAECTAERLVDGAGLETLREAGLLDEDLRYVDRPARSLRPAIVRSLRDAVHACLEVS